MRQFNIGKATANSIGNRFQRRLHQSDPDLFFFVFKQLIKILLIESWQIDYTLRM